MADNEETFNTDFDYNLISLLTISIAIGCVGFVVLIYFIKRNSSIEEKETKQSNKARNKSSVSSNKPKKVTKEFKYPLKKGGLKPHPLSAADFKGHTDTIRSISFELGGKYLASCSDDRTFRVWSMKTALDKEHKYTRVNLDDDPTNIAFSPDGTAILLTTSLSNELMVFKLSKSKNSSLNLNQVLQFELTKETSDSDVISLEISSNGRYIMTCATGSFSLWSLKGDKLCTVDTKQSPNNLATISKCSKFVGCCGFTTDVKIWEVVYSKSNEFQSVDRAMELKGHSAGVLSLCFSQDSKKAVTLSKDKTCKVWNINVSYALNEDPRVLLTIPLQGIPQQLSLSFDSLVIAVSHNTSISLYSTKTGNLLDTLNDVHNAEINCLLFEPSHGRYLISAGSSDRFIRLWHNVPGIKEQISELNDTLMHTSNQTMKDRLKIQLNELEDKLKEIDQSRI